MFVHFDFLHLKETWLKELFWNASTFMCVCASVLARSIVSSIWKVEVLRLCVSEKNSQYGIYQDTIDQSLVTRHRIDLLFFCSTFPNLTHETFIFTFSLRRFYFPRRICAQDAHEKQWAHKWNTKTEREIEIDRKLGEKKAFQPTMSNRRNRNERETNSGIARKTLSMIISFG